MLKYLIYCKGVYIKCMQGDVAIKAVYLNLLGSAGRNKLIDSTAFQSSVPRQSTGRRLPQIVRGCIYEILTYGFIHNFIIRSYCSKH